MRERRVDVRELESKLSECLREVEAGTTIVVMEHGRQVARVAPDMEPVERAFILLRITGAIIWSGRRLGVAKPDVHVRGGRSVSDIAIENRG